MSQFIEPTTSLFKKNMLSIQLRFVAVWNYKSKEILQQIFYQSRESRVKNENSNKHQTESPTYSSTIVSYIEMRQKKTLWIKWKGARVKLKLLRWSRCSVYTFESQVTFLYRNEKENNNFQDQKEKRSSVCIKDYVLTEQSFL